MKILHIIPTLTVEGGGGDRACAELAESQVRLGHDVAVLTFHRNGQTPLAPAGVRLLDCKDPGRVLNKLGISREFLRWASREIPAAEIVHIHSNWRLCNVLAGHLCRAHAVKYFVQPHGNLDPWKFAHKRLMKVTWWLLMDKKLMSRADAVHAESEKDFTNLRRLLPSGNIYISPCGIHTEKIAQTCPAGASLDRWPEFGQKKVILYLGRIDVNKGLDLLLHSLARNRGRIDGFHLLVAGPDYGGTAARLRQLSDRLGVSGMVSWAGVVGEDIKYLMMRNCCLFVLPSRAENFGISVLEALFCKCPVLTTSETAWTVLSEIGAGIVVPPDVEGISQGIVRFLSMNESERSEMGQRGHAFVRERFEWENVARQTVEKYLVTLEKV